VPTYADDTVNDRWLLTKSSGNMVDETAAGTVQTNTKCMKHPQLWHRMHGTTTALHGDIVRVLQKGSETAAGVEWMKQQAGQSG
jgi:hypothetical protein